MVDQVGAAMTMFKPGDRVTPHMEKLWDRNITITTRLVDAVSTPVLLEMLRARKIDLERLVTHRFKLDQVLDAYHTFGQAPETHARKVLIEA